MGKKQKRRSISIRRPVFDRLDFYVRAEKQRDPKAACSAVVEAALAEYLDAKGVPKSVAPAPAPKSVRSEHPMDEKPAIFTF